MPTGPVTVFISYARADRAQVEPIARAIEANGYGVWWDKMIEGGATFAATIEAKLSSAAAVVVVWSKTSVASDWVRDEAAHARDRKCLVPVSLDGTPPPLGFRQYHVVDLSGWRGDPAAEQAQSLLRGIAAAAGTEHHNAAAQSSPPRLSRRTALVGGGVAASAVLAGGLAAWHPWQASTSSNSVAVLPFANLSGEPSQVYFADGLAEELRATLAGNSALKVAAPTSSNVFRNDQGDAKAIAGKLGVAFLLEGSVRRSGQVVRVAADLIDASTGFTSWSETFERTIDDIFAVQSSIANTVARALAVRMARSRPPGGTTNVAAYDAFLRGLALFNADEGEASDRGALAQFDSAIAADPDYATAHAARSRSLAGIAGQYASAHDLQPMFDAAITSARKAIALAPSLAAGQLALGFALFAGKLDIRAARAPYDRAYQLGKGDADTLVLFALFCARTGQAGRAKAAVERAVQLDPLNPRAHRAAASVAYAGRRYADVVAPAQRALALNPKLSNAHALIAGALLMLGRTAEARAMFAAEPNASFRLAGTAIVTHKAGDEAAARQALAQLRAEVGDSALYQQAQVMAQSGDKDGALAALQRARAVGDAGLTYLDTDPMLDPLRSEPRFAALVKNLGFD